MISMSTYLSTKSKGGGKTGTITESSRGNKGDLEGLGSQGKENQTSNIIFTGVTSTLA